MKKIKFFYFILLLMGIHNQLFAATWKKVITDTASAIGTAGTTLTQAQCPDGFILISPLAPYTQHPFCIMKYEAKNDGYGIPISTPSTVPWHTITRDNARIKCRGLGYGYDLVSNEQWQTIARDIINIAENWSTGTLYAASINVGHSDNSPASAQAASANDTQACINTGQTCSDVVWQSQRRTHKLSSGNVIWDFSGNVEEWTSYESELAHGFNQISVLVNSGEKMVSFGTPSSTHCSAWASAPYCGFGYFNANVANAVWSRGSSFSAAAYAGVLSMAGNTVNTTGTDIGFRCVYAP